jgi:hypothetical protein
VACRLIERKNMKKIIICLFCCVCYLVPLSAEILFSGSLKTTLSLLLEFPYEDDRFDTLINPGNVLGVHDLQAANYLVTKLEGEENNTFFGLWLGFNTYRIADALYAAASGDELLVLSESLPFLGTEIGTVELLRAHISFYASDFLVFSIGRQQMQTGYGYGWNPMDFANPLKDPYDPKAELKGVDAVKMTLTLGTAGSVSVSGLYNGDDGSDGIDFEHIMLLSENTFYLPGFEVMVTGLYEYDEDEGEDRTPAGAGLGFKANIFDIGVYGEGAARFGSRNYYYDESMNAVIKTGPLFSALAGIEYVFPNEFMIVAEYFYNGEGFNDDEKIRYEESVLAAVTAFGAPLSEQLLMIIPGYLNQHYILCNLSYPLYDQNMELQCMALFSPDGLMLNVLPRVVFNISGSLTVSLGYTGLFDFAGDLINEASLNPFAHMLSFEGSFYF